MNNVPENFSSRQTALVKQLNEGLTYAGSYINRQYLTNLDIYRVLPPKNITFSDIRLFKIDKFIYDPEEDINDKLITVYSALNAVNSSLIIVICSNDEGISFFMGTKSPNASTAGEMLENALSGNFGGSSITRLKTDETEEIMKQCMSGLYQQKSLTSVTLLPSERDGGSENFVQGLEKLIDAVSGKEFTAVFISEPMSHKAIDQKKSGLEELYSTISPFQEITLAYGTNESSSIAEGTFSSFSDSINESVTHSISESESESKTKSTSTTVGWSSSSTTQEGKSSSSSYSVTDSISSTYSTSLSWSNAVTSGSSKAASQGRNTTNTSTTGSSITMTVKNTNKSVANILKKIEAHLERITKCEAFGLWSCAAYFISDDIQTCTIAANTFGALVNGGNSYLDKAYINTWDGAVNIETKNILESVMHGSHPLIAVPSVGVFEAQTVKPTVMISGQELPLFMILPRKSIPGLVVDNMASFGRSVFDVSDNDSSRKIELGFVMHKGRANKKLKVSLDIEKLCSHCFITGTTGSGKSNTTYRLLESLYEEGIKFLVIEPAKGEYKFAFGNLPDINIFWTLDKYYPILRLNPFSFPAGIHVLEHMDRLIEILNACWPLYSAMPAILKAAVERAYISVGWDLRNSLRLPVNNKEFPTFEDVLRELPKVIDESSYSAQAKGDYTGALVTRVSSLTNGIMGSIFCNESEIDDSTLFDTNTIIDLSRIGSAETKSLLMGIIIMKLNEYRMSQNRKSNSRLQHVTILEEAHNLLRNVGSTTQSQDSANLAGKSIEMISNSIAEMRTYGEGFMIVDQSPTSVDISAIKNTNTKIIMRLPEKNDFEAAGYSFALSDDQIREIARLPRGVAIVSQSGWLEPVMTAIHEASKNFSSDELPAHKPQEKGAVAGFIAEVLRWAGNMAFDDDRIADILAHAGIPENKRVNLMSQYEAFKAKCILSSVHKSADRASFVIRAIGCEALADIYAIDITGSSETTAGQQYSAWCKNITSALEHYGYFGSEREKSHIAADLFIYAAEVLRKENYIKARRILVEGKNKIAGKV